MVLLEGMKHVKATDRNGQTVWLTGYHYTQKWAEWGTDEARAKYINAEISLEQLAKLEHFTTVGGKTTVTALTFVEPVETAMPDPAEREQRKDQAEQEREQRKDERSTERDADKARRDLEKHDRQFEKDPSAPNQDLPDEQPPAPGTPTPGQLPA